MSPTRPWYKELRIPLTEPLEDGPHQARRPHMEEETRDDRARYIIKLLLEEALTQQQNKMMDNFAQILCRLPTIVNTSTSSGHFGGMAPLRVRVNFYVPVFES